MSDKILLPSRSPVIFSEFDPDSGGGGGGGLHSRERRDGTSGEDRVAAMPWQGNWKKLKDFKKKLMKCLAQQIKSQLQYY